MLNLSILKRISSKEQTLLFQNEGTFTQNLYDVIIITS
jgi:hypothetical protein